MNARGRSILAAVKPSATQRLLAVSAIALLAATGCVRRQLSVTSEPAGALVYLNDREAGRTPFTTDFVWYGTYDVVVRKEGYEPLNAKSRVLAPWWGWPPFDLFAEMMPWHPTDLHKLHYKLAEAQPLSTEALVERALNLESKLPATQPATR